MSNVIHCAALCFIVFILANIQTVLLNGTPRQPEKLTIWEEAPKTEKSENSLVKLRY